MTQEGTLKWSKTGVKEVNLRAKIITKLVRKNGNNRI